MTYQTLSELPAPFVGRERELDELRQLAPDSRQLTLCGTGGIGKTQLAGQVVASLADDFEGRAWLVRLADLRQPELLESRIAAAAGVYEEPGRPLVQTLVDTFGRERVLLALDTCEHLAEACARVCGQLLAGAPGLRVLATSREPLLLPAEKLWPVPPLSLPAPPGPPDGSAAPAGLAADKFAAAGKDGDAIALFAARAAAASPGFTLGPDNLVDVVTLCNALRGVPLAIELVAARVAAMPVRRMARDLPDRLTPSGLAGDGGTEGRPDPVHAVLDWSYQLLSTPEQLLLARLSVLAGCSEDMARKVCSGDGLRAAEIPILLGSLAKHALVLAERDGTGRLRYTMHDSVRRFAAARLADTGGTAVVRARLRDYTLGEVEHLATVGMAQIRAPWSATLDVFRRFEIEADNLRQVLSDCLDSGDAETGMRICAAMRPVWIVQGSFTEGSQWLDAFDRLEAREVPPAVRGAALIGRAQLSLASDPVRSAEQATAGLALCRAAGAAFWVGTALNLLAEADLHAGNAEGAETQAAQAQAVAAQAGDRWNEGYALGTRAAAAAYRSELDRAQKLAEDGLEIMRAIDQRWGVARTLLGLGDLARLTGDSAQAQRRYTEALGILRVVNARPEMARCLAGLGRIAMSQSDLVLARRYLTESVRLSLSTGSRIGVIRSLEAFAALAAAEGRPEDALQLMSAAAAQRRAAPLPPASPNQVRRVLDAADEVDPHVVRLLWAAGSGMSRAAAVRLALRPPPRDS